MDTPADRIRAIDDSLRCLVYGCLGFIPLVGLAFSGFAIYHHARVSNQVGSGWNPARRYLLAGYVLAWITGLIWLGVLVLVLGAQISNFNL
jgi:hypothetical protein